MCSNEIDSLLIHEKKKKVNETSEYQKEKASSIKNANT